MSPTSSSIIQASTGTLTKHFVVTGEAEEARAYLAILRAFRPYYPTSKSVLAQKATPYSGVYIDPSVEPYLHYEDQLQELPERLRSTIQNMLKAHMSKVAYRQRELDEILAFTEGVEHVLSLPVHEAVSLQHESGVPLVEYLVMWRSNREYEHVRRIPPGTLPE